MNSFLMISNISIDLTNLLHKDQFCLVVFGDQLDEASICGPVHTIGPFPEGSANLMEFEIRRSLNYIHFTKLTLR